MSFDAERSARIASTRETARPAWEATGDTDTLQQFGDSRFLEMR